jgi:hypothetical protein
MNHKQYEEKWDDTFFRMERENRLFDVLLPDGTPIWDIVRYHVDKKKRFENIEAESSSTIKGRPAATNLLKRIKKIRRNCASGPKIFFNRGENFFFTASRYCNQEKQYFDPYYVSVRNFLPGNVIVCESCYQDHYQFAPTCHSGIRSLGRRAKKEMHLPENAVRIVVDAVKAYLGDGLLSPEDIAIHYNDFISDVIFYKHFFKSTGIKRIFLVQNGIQKGMIRAAKTLGLPVFEFQHGEISRYHFAYSYDRDYAPPANIIAPDVLFTFSDLWTRGMFIPMSCVSIGSDFMYKERCVSKEADSIVVISSGLHETDLDALTLNLAQKAPSLKIYYKLHPSQFSRLQQFKREFKNASNIQVISGEMNIDDLAKIAPIFLGIYSTVIHEAMQAGKKVFIYKRQDYFLLEPYSDLPAMKLFDNCEELLRLIEESRKTDTCADRPIFFKPFDAARFIKTIELYDHI